MSYESASATQEVLAYLRGRAGEVHLVQVWRDTGLSAGLVQSAMQQVVDEGLLPVRVLRRGAAWELLPPEPES